MEEEGLRRHHRLHRLLLEPDPDPAINGTRAIRSSEADFDANMVIVLAALLFALICALGLNSIVRCALRCARGSPDRPPGTVSAGIKRSALRRIPVAVIGTGSGADIPATECPICLGDFVAGDKVRVLPACRHGFHVGCIDTWLVSRSSCPTCRRSLMEEPAACSGTDEGASAPVGVEEVG